MILRLQQFQFERQRAQVQIEIGAVHLDDRRARMWDAMAGVGGFDLAGAITADAGSRMALDMYFVV